VNCLTTCHKILLRHLNFCFKMINLKDYYLWTGPNMSIYWCPCSSISVNQLSVYTIQNSRSYLACFIYSPHDGTRGTSHRIVRYSSPREPGNKSPPNRRWKIDVSPGFCRESSRLGRTCTGLSARGECHLCSKLSFSSTNNSALNDIILLLLNQEIH